jgi:2-polyprenyl-6-methoxyphenol hydroxylase-like FAD-dependent oxidoreductase
MLRDHADVLVVGAGPVGMFTALSLLEHGVRVRIIDKEANTAAKSYACALHPGTLKLFWKAGLMPEGLQNGHRIRSIGLYEGRERRASIRISELPLEFPYILVLPQSDLETLLETKLNKLTNFQLDWNSRLSELNVDSVVPSANIDKLGQTVIGYSVPDFEGVVVKTTHLSADFVVGADGANSMVRRSLGIEYERVGDPELFVVYEFECAEKNRDEMKIVLDGTTVSVMWPLSPNRCRWSFQINRAGEAADFPGKERRSYIMREAQSEEDSKHHLLNLLKQRAPWFEDEIGEVDWSADIEFQHRLATRFGRNRCWLAGDAAHQTTPIGMQSMNIGLREGADLAGRIERVLREKAPIDILDDYNSESQAEWQSLLGRKGPPKPEENTSPWIKAHCSNLQSYLPASGQDLSLLLQDIGLTLG